MKVELGAWRTATIGLALTASWLTFAAAAHADAQTPSISGNGWIALMILIGLIVIIYMIIRGALHLERRDAQLGRGPSKKNDGWFGIFPATKPDEDDAPDFHEVNDGDGDGDGSSN